MRLVQIEEREDSLWVGLNRPERRNALDQEMIDELHLVIDSANKGQPRILVLHSLVEGAFVSGADIAELLERDADSAMLAINAALFDKLERFRWPTIAVVDGYALGGGCELAMACDFRFASERGKFGQPELSLGILAGAGGNWRLPELVGISMARQMLYAGRVLDSMEALDYGLVDQVYNHQELLSKVDEYVAVIASKSWRALELTKLSVASQRKATTSLDVIAQALLFESEDKRIRMGKFLNKKGKSS
ncbi:MAG: enoyl-CoA hydratase/isomerase family protein [Actinobacteria bacterium]|nr:enoyl-CoA hydratase/isomerase family protein [Actinomycetota bacterium]